MASISDPFYFAAIKVGKSERSDVLIANAWYEWQFKSLQSLYLNYPFNNRHHRSDAFSSGVALIAIVGSYAGIPVLDPLGGIAVAAMIMKSGGDILLSALRELMDKGISRAEVEQVAQAVAALKVKKDLVTRFPELCSVLKAHAIAGKRKGLAQFSFNTRTEAGPVPARRSRSTSRSRVTNAQSLPA